MPRYYFHIRTGDEVVEDPEGELCVDLAAARVEAIAAIRELLGWLIREGKDVNGRTLEICDESGHTVDTIKFRDTLNASF